MFAREQGRMFLSIIIGNTSPTKKESFTTTSVRSNGCILEISSQYPKGKARQNSRFTSISFNCSSNLMAILDQNGFVFILDLLNEMYWQVPLSGFCSFIKFLDFSPRELLVCDENNSVLFVNVDEGFAVRELKGHLYPVKFISSTNDKNHLMTSSLYETIIWDLDTNTQKHKLFLAKKIAIKLITFLPHSNNILACFQDDSLTVWSFNTFDCMHQFIPNDWRGHHLKSIAFTRDGKIMAIGGVDTYMTLFHMETWSLYKRIPLPIQISHVKYSTFLDNKILVIITASGEIYFLDIETAAMKSSNYYASPSTSHIYSVACSFDGRHTACSLYSGQILLFNTELLLHEKPCSRLKWKSPAQKKRHQVKAELKEVNQKMSISLDINRLRPLLKQFAEYPAKFRPLVWKTILKIPHNLDAYKSLDSKPLHWAADKLDEKYPVQNSSLLKALKRLMSCLSHWNPLFSLITYLPEFVFPFVTLLRNEPCALFEIIVTIIVNHCQHWFQYFPFPPINTLALIENILADRDPGLLEHYYRIGLTSNVYAWLLLQSAFSEVLAESQWLVLWDHVLSNEPWFLLMTVVAFNIQCRNVILSMDKIELIENFFHSQNALDVHKLMKIAYELNSTVSSDVHPRQYYKQSVPLIQGPVYQPYEEYPKFVVDYQVRKLNDIREEEEKILKQEVDTLERKKTMETRMKNYLSEEIHAARMQELEDVYKTVLREEEERVYREKLKLSKLKSELRKQEVDMMNATRAKIMKDKADRKHASLDRLLDDIERKKNMEKIELDEIEEDAKQHFLELLVSKQEMEREIDNLYKTKCKLGVSETDVLEQQQEEVRGKLNEVILTRNRDNLYQM
uniref:TBC1 domain family member 31 n=1 Tax=Cacopsylla melanoneura TaxID=428564 RepID=A0A8D9A8H8_9HEMI